MKQLWPVSLTGKPAISNDKTVRFSGGKLLICWNCARTSNELSCAKKVTLVRVSGYEEKADELARLSPIAALYEQNQKIIKIIMRKLVDNKSRE